MGKTIRLCVLDVQSHVLPFHHAFLPFYLPGNYILDAPEDSCRAWWRWRTSCGFLTRNKTNAAQSGCKRFGSPPATDQRVPHISLVFREIWGTRLCCSTQDF